jgi:hypothetical protein
MEQTGKAEVRRILAAAHEQAPVLLAKDRATERAGVRQALVAAAAARAAATMFL